MSNFSTKHSRQRFPRCLEDHPAILPDSEKIKEYAAELVDVLKKVLKLSENRLGKNVDLAAAIMAASNQQLYDGFKALRGGTLARYPAGNLTDLATLLRAEMLIYLEQRA